MRSPNGQRGGVIHFSPCPYRYSPATAQPQPSQPNQHGGLIVHSPGQSFGESKNETLAVVPVPNFEVPAGPHDQLMDASAGKIVANTNTYSTQPPERTYPASDHMHGAGTSLPEETSFSFDPSYPASAFGIGDGVAWNNHANESGLLQGFEVNSLPPSVSPQFPPPRSRNLHGQKLPKLETSSPSQPQDFHDSSVSSAHSTQSFQNPFRGRTSAYGPLLTPHAPRSSMEPEGKMAQVQHSPTQHAMQLSEIANMTEQLTRKRSHDEMMGAPTAYPIVDQLDQHATQNGNGEVHSHSRAGSVISQQQDGSGAEGASPEARTRTIKRGEPPRDAQGKLVCNFSEECTGIIFDRKCEWR